jgi:hypothetical protein
LPVQDSVEFVHRLPLCFKLPTPLGQFFGAFFIVISRVEMLHALAFPGNIAFVVYGQMLYPMKPRRLIPALHVLNELLKRRFALLIGVCSGYVVMPCPR